MTTSPQNKRLLFTVIVAAVLALLVARMLERGLGDLGGRRQALALSDELARCTDRGQYLALLKKNYPERPDLWREVAPPARQTETTPILQVERNGTMKVIVFAITEENMLDPSAYTYVPAALVDESGRGWHLENVRVNSYKTRLVFEYLYKPPVQKRSGRSGRHFRFFRATGQWELVPSARRP